MLCAAPLVASAPSHCSAYNVKGESKRIGCCKYLYIAVGMDTPTDVSKLVTSTELPLSSPIFHAFGKAYPGPNLLQVCATPCLFIPSSFKFSSVICFCLGISQ